MRKLLAIPLVIAIATATAGAANATDDIVCGRIMGMTGATASAPGAMVIPQPGDVAPAGTYIVIPPGMTQVTSQGVAWVCVRTTSSPPTQVLGGFTSTRTFVAFVAPDSPGYRAEPAAASPRGPLPSTSTAPGSAPLVPLALSLSGLLALGLLALRRRGTLG